jgi:hypothetical protein
LIADPAHGTLTVLGSRQHGNRGERVDKMTKGRTAARILCNSSL